MKKAAAKCLILQPPFFVYTVGSFYDPTLYFSCTGILFQVFFPAIQRPLQILILRE